MTGRAKRGAETAREGGRERERGRGGGERDEQKERQSERARERVRERIHAHARNFPAQRLFHMSNHEFMCTDAKCVRVCLCVCTPV